MQFNFIKVAGFIVLSLLLVGCFANNEAGQLDNLVEAGRQRSLVDKQIAKDEKKFRHLKADVLANHLKPGVSLEEFKNIYGEPTAVLAGDKAALITQKLLYRSPVEFFDTDRVYLLFDENNLLKSWEYLPAIEHGA